MGSLECSIHTLPVGSLSFQFNITQTRKQMQEMPETRKIIAFLSPVEATRKFRCIVCQIEKDSPLPLVDIGVIDVSFDSSNIEMAT